MRETFNRRLKELASLENFVGEEKFSDVSLHIDGTKFHVHKIILASKSPVFAAMFDHQMKENIPKQRS